MYYYIKGTLVQKNDNYIVVDANGVGYMIYTSLNSMQNAGEVGKKITIYTYLHLYLFIKSPYNLSQKTS